MKRGWSRIILVEAGVAFLITFGTGCGSTTKVTSQTNDGVGQQLIDLEQAHSKGIISDKEYEKLRKQIVQKND
jgi:hypothetical protein